MNAPSRSGQRTSDARSHLTEVAARFDPVALDGLREAILLERVDRKFIAPMADVPGLLASLRHEYRLLEVNGVRLHRYLTRYFDTPELTFYHAHHAGRRPRSKVRIREYQDSGLRYIEVKRRANTGQTSKSRVMLVGDAGASDALHRLPELGAAELRTDLHEVLDVRYTRLTLVHAIAAERITLDVDLTVCAGARSVTYGAVSFIEVKQARRGASPFVDALRAHRLRERSISKYCLGVVSLIEHAKTNRFRRAVRRLQQQGAP